MTKQVIIWRNDLKVRKGKFAAQVAHASLKVFFDRMIYLQSAQYVGCFYDLNYKVPKIYTGNFTKEMQEWIEGSFTKIVVGCNSLEELLELQKKADEAKIVNALITDNGNTEFKEVCSICNGTGKDVNTQGDFLDVDCSFCKGIGKVNKPTITCLAIGPDEAEKIDLITSKLQLL